MAEQQQLEQPRQAPQLQEERKSRQKLIIIMANAVKSSAWAVSWPTLSSWAERAKVSRRGEGRKDKRQDRALPLDPFGLTLVECGRFVKVTKQLELKNSSFQHIANEIPQFRGAVMTRRSGKLAESVASSEGKFRFKDKVLLRANQVTGKKKLKNLYFTEFIIQ